MGGGGGVGGGGGGGGVKSGTYDALRYTPTPIGCC